MRNLSKADAALASALDRLSSFHVASTGELNALQIMKAELNSARSALADARVRITALEQDHRRLSNTPQAAAAAKLTRYGAMFEHALDAILIADDEAGYLEANPAACALLGYTRDELLQRGVVDITPESQRHLVPQLWREFLHAGSMTGEYSVQTRAGDALAVEFRAVANVLPGEHLSILRDVSRLRQAQQELQTQERERQASALSALYDVLDTLLAAKLDAQGHRGWRAALIGSRRHHALEAAIERAMINVRTAIDALEQSRRPGE